MKKLINPKHYDFIDALRGYAILGVIVVHVASALPPTQGAAMRLFEQGARGVQLFYVASAVTLLMSWHSRNDGYIPFMLRRLFRIVPLFWMEIPVYLSFSGLGAGYFAPHPHWSSIDIMRQMFFVDSILPNHSSVVPGGWTVNTEMLFYLLFPLFLLVINSWRIAIAAYCLTLFIAIKLTPLMFAHLLAIFPDIDKSMIAVWVALSLPTQLPIFLAGFTVFFLLRERNIIPEHSKALLMGMLVISFCLTVWYSFSPPRTYGFWGIPLGLLVFCFGRGAAGILVNKVIIFLGKVSFSAYILHFMVLNFVYLGRDIGFNVFGLGNNVGYIGFLSLLLFVLLITSAISFISYRLIERPMIRFGNRFIDSRFIANELLQVKND